MKTSVTLIFVVFLSMPFVLAQDREAAIAVEKKNFILDIVNNGNDGLVIKTGNDNANTKKLDWHVYYFSHDLQLKWEKEIEKDQLNKGFLNPFVVAPNGSYTYQLEYMGYNTMWGAKNLMINQLNTTGDLKRKEIRTELIEGDGSAVFCNDQYLYFLTEEKVKRGSDKVLQMRLVKLAHDKLHPETVKLNLPFITDYDSNTDWMYLNHDNDYIYLYHKTSENDGQYTYIVAKLNAEGKVEDDNIRISYDLGDKYIRASNNEKSNNAYNMFRDSYPDFEEESSANSSSMIYMPTIGAYGGLVMDPDNGAFYVYGLYGNEKARNIGTKYDGLFVIKYDEKGRKDWELVQPGSSELLSDKYFTIHAVPYSRNLHIHTNPFSKDIQLQLRFKKSAYALEISESGQVKGSELCEFRDLTTSFASISCFTAQDRLGMRDYLKKYDERELEKIYLNHQDMPDGDLLIIGNEDKESYDLLLFKD